MFKSIFNRRKLDIRGKVPVVNVCDILARITMLERENVAVHEAFNKLVHDVAAENAKGFAELARLYVDAMKRIEVLEAKNKGVQEDLSRIVSIQSKVVKRVFTGEAAK